MSTAYLKPAGREYGSYRSSKRAQSNCLLRTMTAAGASNGGAAAASNAARSTAAKVSRGRGSKVNVEDILTPEAIAADVELRKKTCLGRLSLRLLQPQVRRAYLNRRVQIFIAVMIAGNFVSNVVEKQIDPWGDKFPDEWYLIETAWNVLFILELIWNMWGCFYLSQWNGHFLSSPWNLFDLSIVALSIPLIMRIELGNIFGQLRMLRAFRVFRLFKRVKSLNKILVSLGYALPGIFNAGVVVR